ncbi:RNA dependent RNA polymerase-domain-containing protein [Flagelloscypha sp. PMI_526]|nr:RNA dependent RNA polymerase-domain-containing protein [Flagelloscypha sp. PMI_526]
MKLGLWTTYRFTSIMSSARRDIVRGSLGRLRLIVSEKHHDETGLENDTQFIEHDIEVYQARPSTAMNYIEDYLRREYTESFACQYLMLGLISQGILPPHQDTVGTLLHKLKFNIKTEAILSGLFRLDRLPERHMDWQIKHIEIGPSTSDSLPDDRIYMRRIVVTPTRVILHHPSIETSNRVIRAWPRFQDNFIRVTFTDEGDKLKFGPWSRIDVPYKKNPRVGVLHRIRCALKHGIHVGPRHYVFLAAGESQMKEHSCWMIYEVPEAGFTANAVRAKMGDFSNIPIVAKYASRMGLCFSASRHIRMQIRSVEIDDITHVGPGGKEYTYTDGIGRCSVEIAQRCARALTGVEDFTPSAIQIRMGGYKGVLSVHRDLPANTVEVRRSMSKFPCNENALGVMKISTHSHAHLNRQAISLLSFLGVPDHIFIQRMERQIHDIRNIEASVLRLDNSRHTARRMYRFCELPVLQMLRAGFAKEPMLANVLKCIECQLLQDLKFRARIQIEDGAFLMGIADEFNVLKPGEVYVAIQLPGQGRRVITGPVTIYRSPSLHPGDIQRATAVDVSIWDDKFAHAPTNVVVFSTVPGKRDLPSQMSGGDLDGDCFTVIWDPDFLITPEKPMDYTPVAPVKMGRSIVIDDILRFFVDFMTSDVLGLVSHTHLALSDKYSPSHPHCIRLAQLASNAVDFGKSGAPVNLPEHLMKDRSRPDFMSSPGQVCYRSEKVLGDLFRLIEPPPKFVPSSDAHVMDSRLQLVAMSVPFKYMRQAGKLKHTYDIELEGYMRRYQMCEAELWAGVNVNGDRKKRRERDSAARGPVKEAMEVLRKTWRKQARSFVDAQRDAKGMRYWALAAYRVTHDPDAKASFVDINNESRRGTSVSVGPRDSMGPFNELEEGEIRVTRVDLLSWPWLWAAELCDAANDSLKIIKEEDEDEDEELLRDRAEDEAAHLNRTVEYS